MVSFRNTYSNVRFSPKKAVQRHILYHNTSPFNILIEDLLDQVLSRLVLPGQDLMSKVAMICSMLLAVA